MSLSKILSLINPKVNLTHTLVRIDFESKDNPREPANSPLGMFCQLLPLYFGIPGRCCVLGSWSLPSRICD